MLKAHPPKKPPATQLGDSPKLPPRDLKVEAENAAIIYEGLLSKATGGDLNASRWAPHNLAKNPDFVPANAAEVEEVVRLAREYEKKKKQFSSESSLSPRPAQLPSSSSSMAGSSASGVKLSPTASPFVPCSTQPPDSHNPKSQHMASTVTSNEHNPGLGVSRWAIQGTQNAASKPEGMIASRPLAYLSPPFIPKHLQGICHLENSNSEEVENHTNAQTARESVSKGTPSVEISHESIGVSSEHKVGAQTTVVRNRQRDVDSTSWVAALSNKIPARLSRNNTYSEKAHSSTQNTIHSNHGSSVMKSEKDEPRVHSMKPEPTTLEIRETKPAITTSSATAASLPINTRPAGKDVDFYAFMANRKPFHPSHSFHKVDKPVLSKSVAFKTEDSPRISSQAIDVSVENIYAMTGAEVEAEIAGHNRLTAEEKEKALKAGENGSTQFPARNAKPAKSAIHSRFALSDKHIDEFTNYIQNKPTSGKKYTFTGAPGNNENLSPMAKSQVVPEKLPQRDDSPAALHIRNKNIQSQGTTENVTKMTTKPADMKLVVSCEADKSVKKPAGQELDRSNRIAAYEANPWATRAPRILDAIQLENLAKLKTPSEVSADRAALTRDNLMAKVDLDAAELPNRSWSDNVSDIGLLQQTREVVRATEAPPGAEDLRDWDGSWVPPPCDWDYRSPFDNSYVRAYIKEWCLSVPDGDSVNVDTKNEGFGFGKPVINNTIGEELEHPDCVPDITNTTDENKRLYQTAFIDSNNYLAKYELKMKKVKKVEAAQAARYVEIDHMEPVIDLFAPKIDLYLRPVDEKDVDCIIKVYNYYIDHSIIPEDQEKLNREAGLQLIRNIKADKLPFIVAVKGRAPTLKDVQGRPGISKKACMPRLESVIGFAFAEHYNYGWAGLARGRSRATATLQLYVQQEYTNRGVGRNLLDRLIHIMSYSWGYKRACDWINPDNYKVCESSNSGNCHQLLFMVPVEKGEDPHFTWLSKFLFQKFFFREKARLHSVARSSIHQGAARFLDLAILQCQALQAAEFDSYV